MYTCWWQQNLDLRPSGYKWTNNSAKAGKSEALLKFYRKQLTLLKSYMGNKTSNIAIASHTNYHITGIFCGCLIFAGFYGSIEISEIKNRKYSNPVTMMKSCPKWLFSRVYRYSDASAVLLLNYLYNMVYTVIYCTPGYETVIWTAHGI